MHRLLLVSILISVNSFAYLKDKTYKLTILHTNDHHGRFWKNSDDEYGMAARMTLIQKIRKEVAEKGGYTLLLSGGDINTGVPESDMQLAEPDFKGMRMLQYDAMAIGNHEFDNPQSVIKKQEEWAGFPFLSANILKKNKKFLQSQHAYKPFIIKKFKGLKVGIVGFTTKDTPQKTDAKNVKGLIFEEPTKVAPRIIKKLKRRGADMIVAVTHMGHYVNANHGNEAPGDVTLARSVKGIDIIVGGHTQKPLFKPDVQNGTHIVQAHEWGKYVGRMDIEFKNGKWKMVDYELIPVNLAKNLSKRIPEHPEMLKLLTPYQKKGQEKLNVVIGETLTRLEGERSYIRNQQTNLGVLMGLALKSATQADLAIYNSGGIRDSILKGKITYRDVLKVEPFGNTIVTVKLTANELKNYLEIAYRNEKGSGGFPQIAGANGIIKDGKVIELFINGVAVDPKKSYVLAVTSFLATGGDKYFDLSNHQSFYNTQIPIAGAVKTYIKKNSPIDLPVSVGTPFIKE